MNKDNERFMIILIYKTTKGVITIIIVILILITRGPGSGEVKDVHGVLETCDLELHRRSWFKIMDRLGGFTVKDMRICIFVYKGIHLNRCIYIHTHQSYMRTYIHMYLYKRTVLVRQSFAFAQLEEPRPE